MSEPARLPDENRSDDAVRAGEASSHLVEVMHRIMATCVWTQGMSHDALLPYIVEEAAELIEAVEAGTVEDVVEELGDVLWQIVFHAEIAATAGEGYAFSAVADRVASKMIRRHTHVFGPHRAETVAQVEALWTAAKAAEKSQRSSILDGIAEPLSGLSRAQKVLGRIASNDAGVATADSGGQGADSDTASTDARDREAADGPVDERTSRETMTAASEPTPDVAEDATVRDSEALDAAFGRRFVALVTEARACGVDAEGALRRELRRIEDAQRRRERGSD